MDSAENTRDDIKTLDIGGLRDLVAELGAPAFRARQLAKWLYGRRVRSFDEMTDLPAEMRQRLGRRFVIGRLTLAAKQVSADGTRKYLWRLPDGAAVESVGLPTDDRLTVCFSTQAGCAMGCRFCATGEGGFTRNLSAGEIADQVLDVGDDFGRRVTNAVAMGQGEPFANYDSALGALRILNSDDGPGIGARHLTVSTCGIVPGIRRFAEEPEQFTLAVSLHSAVQTTRDILMPGVRRFPLDELREALIAYSDATGRRPSLEYALLDGINDTVEELDALIAFCRGMLCHVNLIPANPVPEARYERSTGGRVRDFLGALQRAGIETSVRAERGVDIDAACGQLSQRHQS